MGSGATTRYIRKLKEQVNSAATYYFPIGVNKNYLGRHECHQLKFNSTPASTGILSFIEIGTKFTKFQCICRCCTNEIIILLLQIHFHLVLDHQTGIIDWMKLTEK